MSVPIPLSVRVYQTFSPLDWDITKYVDNFTYRSVVPGGFASMTLKLRQPTALYAPDQVVATATASVNSSTPDYIVVPDAQAANIPIGKRGWVYTSSGAIRFNGVRLRVVSKGSFAGFTNIGFDRALGITNTGDVFQVSEPGQLLTSLPAVSTLAQVFNRIQVVDKRNAEIVWEGRIEEPARESSEPNVWELSCLGSMIAATDVQRPMFYIDSGPENWRTDAYDNNDSWDLTIDDRNGATCELQWKDGSTAAGATQPTVDSNASGHPVWLFSHGLARSMGLFIGRFRVKMLGHDDMNPTGSNTDTDGALRGAVVFRAANYDPTAQTDLKLFNYTQSEFQDILGSDLTINDAQDVVLCQTTTGGTNVNDRSLSTGGHNIGMRYSALVVQVQRKDRFGNALTTSASYTHGNYVTVPMIVEDVIGRFLVEGWDLLNNNAPYPGSVRPIDVYIDSTSTKQITQAVFKDSATAADILNFCVENQTNAYWGIWESKFGAYTYLDSFGNNYSEIQFRFEWATWPASWGYFIDDYDELNEQPSGEDLFNYAFLTYKDLLSYKQTSGGSVFTVPDTSIDQLQISWGEGINSRSLDVGGFTRAAAWRDDNVLDAATANTVADQFRRDHASKTNAGTVKVSKPVYFFDAGVNSWSGASRMLDPWAIRPGKLVRIKQLLGESGSLDHSFGSTALSAASDGSIFRCAAVEYDSSSNQATLELDQPANWNLPGQVVR